MTLRSTVLFSISLCLAGETFSADKADIDKMTTYAVILGRGIACGAETDEPSRRVGRWMDRVFPPGSQDQKIYLPIFMEGTRMHAKLQRDGRSPDTCDAVLRSFRGFPWP